MEVLVTDRRMLRSAIGIRDGEIGLYRLEDGVIESIPATKEAVLLNCLPVFRTFVESDLTDENETIAAYVGEELTSGIRKLLLSLGTAFPEYLVGFLGRPLIPILEHVTMQAIGRLPFFIAFTMHARGFYPFVERDLTFESISDYLRGITNGSLEPKYHTEPIPEVQAASWTKLVGKTYADFICDITHDLFVLYVKPDSHRCREVAEEFAKAAEALRGTGVRFGVIDVVLNSSPIPFPSRLNPPHLRFFPFVNRSDGYPFMHTVSRDNLLRFVKHFGSKDYEIEVPPKNIQEFKREVREFSKAFPDLPEEDQDTMSAYFHKMWFSLGLGRGIDRDP
jgi:hypothetical protein